MTTVRPERTVMRRHRSRWVALGGSAAALVPALFLFDFTVDDALITARYAHHVAIGAGYRFNESGPVTDGVTPLGWAVALSPLASVGPIQALAAAKAIGVVAWILSAAVLAIAVDAISERRARFAALALLPASAPLAAWSAAGMETGVVAALGALAAALPPLGYPWAGIACAGAAAALRPEMLPFALVLALAAPRPASEGIDAAGAGEGSGSGRETTPRSLDPRFARILALALAGLPFVAVALLRLVIFGRPAPLAALAKAPDGALGARYALACFLLTGPLSLVAPLAWRAVGRWPRGLVAAVFAHFLAVAAAGGDWMPLSRLVVPALPATILGAAYLASAADARLTALRLAAALAGELYVLVKVGPTAARVGRDRAQIMSELHDALENANVVATLDVGWVGAVTRARIVDLAGVTDPAVAAFPGGHTTRRIPAGLLSSRNVDTLVLLLADEEPLKTPWTASRFARGVEQHVARFPQIDQDFMPVALSAVPHLRYLVLRRIQPALR